MHARTIGWRGACTAWLTYRDNDAGTADVQEADMEGDDVEGASTNASMPKGVTWSDWAVHRMDWTPRQSTWFANGAEVADIKLQAPKDPSRILFIAWSDGGSWTGKMAVNDTAYLQIQWIEFVFNVTGTNDANDRKRRLAPKPEGGPEGGPHSPPTRCDVDNGCKVVCSIDESGHVGEAVMLWNGTSDGYSLATRHGFSTAFWLPAVIVPTMALSSMSVL